MTDRHAAWSVLAAAPCSRAGDDRAGRADGRPPPAATAMRTEPAKVNCRRCSARGVQRPGVVLRRVHHPRSGRGGHHQVAAAHRRVTLTFDLHNRHTYSEELAKTSRGYRRYTAMVGLLAADNTPLGRAVVQSEFRNAPICSIAFGRNGPGGVKAVAPTGAEPISIVIPADEPTDSLSIVGLRLTEARIDGRDQFVAPGRPIAIISNVMLRVSAGTSAAHPRSGGRRHPGSQ